MIAGHFGFAAGVKAQERSVPLWALMLACQWLDVVFVPLLLLGVERLEPLGHGGYGQVVIHADWTHSLAGAIVLSALFGAFFRSRGGVVLAAVSFSHWILDLIVHRADMPIVPWGAARIGFGLWRWPAAAGALELCIVLAGAALYWRAALATGARRQAHAAGAAVLATGLFTLGLNLLGF